MSVTLSEDVVKMIDKVARAGETQSQTIERLLRERLETDAGHAPGSGELALINRHADQLNAEAADVLQYQVRRVR